jgi:hypothetical protein
MLALTRKSRAALVAVATFGLAAASQAITFSNITMVFNPTGTGNGASTSTGLCDIDFVTPNFSVGDFGFGPARVATLTITYEAMDAAGMMAMNFSLLGNVGGSGMIQFSEVIEDMTNPGIIGSIPVTAITSSAQLPAHAFVNFSRTSTHIKVKKEILIVAEPDTLALDFARVGLIEQKIVLVPEPGTMVAAGLGLAALVGRRRRN